MLYNYPYLNLAEPQKENHVKKKNGLKLQLNRETLFLLDLSKVAGGTSYTCTVGTCDARYCLGDPLTARDCA